MSTGNKRKSLEGKKEIPQTKLGKTVSKKDKQIGILQEALKKGTVNDVLGWMKDSGVITLDSDTTIYSALMILIDSKITSAPVKNKETNEYSGFVSMNDLVAATVEILKKTGALKKKGQDAQTDDEFEFFEQDIIMESLNVQSVTDFAKLDEFVSVKASQTAFEAAEILQNHHHCAVVNDNGVLIGVLSQSTLMEYISEEHALIIDKMKLKVKDLELPKQVHSVLASDSAISAFKKMTDKKVSGLAVVSKEDTLMDAISVRDLTLFSEWVAAGQVIHFHNICALASTVKKFLETSRTQRGITQKKFPVTCTYNSLVNETISTMLVEQVHRLFVVDEDVPTKLLSVVTHGNLIRNFLS